MERPGIDLRTRYLGLELKNPLVVSAGPLSREVGTVRELEDRGAAAVVMFSLFEEEVVQEEVAVQRFLDLGTESYGEALSYLPPLPFRYRGPEEYLDHLQRLKEAVDIPVMASLNGMTAGGWMEYARRVEEAGADAIELNVYYLPAGVEEDGRRVEERYLEALRAVRERVRIPVAMKLSPYFSSLGSMALRLEAAGADGLVLFNRFYQPDIDLQLREAFPNLVLSGPADLRLPLRWIAILRDRLNLCLAATGGVHSAGDALKAVLVGADAVMLCSALLRRGPPVLEEVLQGMAAWMEEQECSSLDEVRGSMSYHLSGSATAFERANYLRGLTSFR